MVYQPTPVMNHPAWILCHLCLYHPAILGLVQNESFRDPRQSPDASRYDEGSTPVPDLRQYPRKATLVEQFMQGHNEISFALRQMKPALLSSSAQRWFARMLEKYKYGILNHCKHPIHTSKLEGVNNKIKVIKRIAYGFHDLEYFAIKVKQALPGHESSN